MLAEEATLATSRGGLNLSSYTTGDIVYASSSSVIAKLGIGTTGQALKVVGGVPAWGTLAEVGGGTNQTSYATGDILYASGASTLSKLTIGSTSQVLKVVGGAPAWANLGQTLVVGAKTTTYSIVNTDDALTADTSTGFTMTLPDCATNSGKVFKIKKITSDLNVLTISKAGSDTIQDSGAAATTTTLNTQGEEIEICSFGSTVWQVLNRKIPSVWISYIPTIQGLGTVSALTAFYRRLGDSIEVMANWTNGTVAASPARITIPTGISISTTKALSNSTGNPGPALGFWVGTGTGITGAITSESATDGSYVLFGNQYANGSGQLITQNGNAITTSSVASSCKFTVPINGWNG